MPAVAFHLGLKQNKVENTKITVVVLSHTESGHSFVTPGDPSSGTGVQMGGLPHQKVLWGLSKAAGEWDLEKVASGGLEAGPSDAGVGCFIPSHRFCLAYSIRVT